MIKSIKSKTFLGTTVFLSILAMGCSPQMRSVAESGNLSSKRVAKELGQRRVCKKSQANDPYLYTSDFKWGYQFEEMLTRFSEMYNSNKRLFNRAYFDEALQSYVMEVTYGQAEKRTKLNPTFLSSVRQHIEVSLQRHYTDAIFFPDMGHSHLFIPDGLYKKLDQNFGDDKALFYEKVFESRDVKILYHTAEQLSVTADGKMSGELSPNKYLQWRYYSRNVVGQNDGSDNVTILFDPKNEGFNTIKNDGLPGYYYYGAGFNLSANKDGCFEFTHEGQTYYYDLSFDDLQYDPHNSNGQDGM